MSKKNALALSPSELRAVASYLMVVCPEPRDSKHVVTSGVWGHVPPGKLDARKSLLKLFLGVGLILPAEF